MVKVELQLSKYINPETNEIQLFRYILQDKYTNQVMFDEQAKEILKFYSLSDAYQYIYEQSYIKSDYKVRKVGANTIADLTTTELIRRGLL